MRLQFDKTIYDKRALLKAAYSFSDIVYLHLEQDERFWYVSWVPKENVNISEKCFENELIAQSLRLHLLNETKDIRKLILARAFASTIIDTQTPNEQQSPNNILEDNEVSEDEAKDVLHGWFD